MKIIILGGGPTGCAAAYFLQKKGNFDITIYEKAEIGGCARTSFYEKIPYEFGPQIMFTDREYLRCVFERFLTCYLPPNRFKKYKYAVDIAGMMKNFHNFPITFRDIFRFKNRAEIICELCRANLKRPDYSNFETYCISRTGKFLYEKFIKNYNKKAWQMNPCEMDCGWVHFRPIKVHLKAARFGDQWQGHPGNYNPMWEAMSANTCVKKINVDFGEDFEYFVDGERVEADLIITTIPLSKKLKFINTCIVYAALKSDLFVMPCATTTFPNNYDFTRVFEYKQQFFVASEYTVVSFEFPWKDECQKDHYLKQALWFCKNILKKEVKEWWVDNRETIYPLATRKNNDYFNQLIGVSASKNIIPLGRAGMHAYVSKDTCLRMGMETADYLDELMNPGKKVQRLASMRKNLH